MRKWQNDKTNSFTLLGFDVIVVHQSFILAHFYNMSLSKEKFGALCLVDLTSSLALSVASLFISLSNDIRFVKIILSDERHI